MHLYFSGVASKNEAEMLQEAGVTRVLIDPLDLPNVTHNGHKTFTHCVQDSRAYRDWKTGTEPVEVEAYLRTALDNGPWDMVIGPDVFADPVATRQRWEVAYRWWGKHAPLGLPLAPVWHWGADLELLDLYLTEAELVAIGGLVPLMRAKDQAMLVELQALCERFPSRFHILGINWLKAIEELQDLAFSGDTSKWLDGARYGHVIFANSRTGHLSQAPARVLNSCRVPNLRGCGRWSRQRRCVESARNMAAFCNGGGP